MIRINKDGKLESKPKPEELWSIVDVRIIPRNDETEHLALLVTYRTHKELISSDGLTSATKAIFLVPIRQAQVLSDAICSELQRIEYPLKSDDPER